MNRLLLVVFLAGGVAVGLFGYSGPSPADTSSTPSGGTPKTAADFYAVGFKAAAAKNYTDAINDFNSAIAIKADYAEAYNMLGYCLRMTGNVQDSMQKYRKALELKPDFPEAREYYGEAFLMDNNLNGAVAQYIVILKTNRKQAGLLLESIAKYLTEHPAP
jgi:tetratricopeptide (TPR) repeat protein